MNFLEMIGIIFFIILVLNFAVGLFAYFSALDVENENVPYIKIHKKY